MTWLIARIMFLQSDKQRSQRTIKNLSVCTRLKLPVWKSPIITACPTVLYSILVKNNSTKVCEKATNGKPRVKPKHVLLVGSPAQDRLTWYFTPCVCVCVTEKVSSMLSALIVPFKYMSPGPSSTEDEDTLSEYKTNMVDTITKNIVIVYKGSIQYLWEYVHL